MSYEKQFCLAGEKAAPDESFFPPDARVTAVRLDGNAIPDCMFCETGWYLKPCARPGLARNESDKLLIFIGSDANDPEHLNAEVELWIENDKLILRDTCVVFVPAGASYGNIEVRNVMKPVLFFVVQPGTSFPSDKPALAEAAAGTYAGNHVERYEPVGGRLPEAPEGFLTRLLWIDGKKLRGAPYLEAVWFHKTNNTGPDTHSHEFDEVIGFLGTDPENPYALGATVTFEVEGETIAIDKSSIIYIPRGMRHSPILVPSLDRPIIHFTGGNGSDYLMK